MDAGSPLISVVMPVWKGDRADWLHDAIESILAQTHGQLELIVVMNGPVDPAIEGLIASAAERDTRVRRMALPVNMGPGFARNAGIDGAKGAYIAFLDADDVALPERIGRQIAFLEETGVHLAGSAYVLIDENGHEIGIKRMPYSDHTIKRQFMLRNPIGNSTVMAHAQVFEAGRYRPDFRYGEDYNLWITLARQGCTFANCPEPLIQFRVPRGFVLKRSGFEAFRTDILNKLLAISVTPVWLVPLFFPVALAVSCARLLPAPLLHALYSLAARAR